MTGLPARSMLHDLRPAPESFGDAVLAGLSRPQKSIPPRFFYDARGSRLFERITELEEYYVTRTELRLLERIGPALGQRIGDRAQLIEFGCGSSAKVRALLDAAPGVERYVPIDISKSALGSLAACLAERYPDLRVTAICADYMRPLDSRLLAAAGYDATVGFFPGSTIGNLEPEDAVRFLDRVGELLDRFIVGVDLVKDVATLEAAYDDERGITAEFNKNLLHRVNRELGGDFDPDAFEHRAFWNAGRSRIEMHLVSAREQTARVGDVEFRFAPGETIHTESSYKYTIEGFRELAERAGYRPGPAWTDERRWFGIHSLERE